MGRPAPQRWSQPRGSGHHEHLGTKRLRLKHRGLQELLREQHAIVSEQPLGFQVVFAGSFEAR